MFAFHGDGVLALQDEKGSGDNGGDGNDYAGDFHVMRILPQ